MGLMKSERSMKRIATFFLFSALLCGCEVVESVDWRRDSPIFTASFEEALGTKVYVDPSLKLCWNAGDKISVFASSVNEPYAFTGSTGDIRGVFEPAGPGASSDARELSTNYAVFPHDASTSITDDEKIRLVLPSVQEFVTRSFAFEANTMVAVSSGPSDRSLPFRNLCGYLVVKLYGDCWVKSVSICGNNGEKLAGPATVTASFGSALSLEFGEGATDTVTIDCWDGIELDSDSACATEFWFCLPPVTFSKGFTVTVVDTEDRVVEFKTTTSRVVARNVKVSMSARKVVFAPDVASQVVDLGLSVKWAACNLGAASPEDCGDYYAWGEREPYYESGDAQESSQTHWKSGKTAGYDWKWSNYLWKSSYADWDEVTFSKYQASDRRTVLDAEDDAASSTLGGGFRMPTEGEWKELLDNCTWTWTTENGVQGYLVSRQDKSIFLPAAGFRFGTSLHEVGSLGNYWSSSINQEYTDLAWHLDFSSGRVIVNDYDRCYGYSVRPVSD